MTTWTVPKQIIASVYILLVNQTHTKADQSGRHAFTFNLVKLYICALTTRS